jgi:hypothetical protein
MSCFVLSTPEINTLVRAGIRWGLIKRASADLVGQALLNENICSVTRRYPDIVGAGGSMPGPVDMAPPVTMAEGDVTRAWITPSAYRYVPRAEGEARLDPCAVRRLLGTYDYQCCEHPEWNTSAARAYCDALAAAIG